MLASFLLDKSNFALVDAILGRPLYRASGVRALNFGGAMRHQRVSGRAVEERDQCCVAEVMICPFKIFRSAWTTCILRK